MSELCDYPTEELVEELEHRGIEVQPLIEHHEKYLEIDGEDKTIWVTHKKHREIHKKWREQGRVIPEKISHAAAHRTKKGKIQSKIYHQKPERKEVANEWNSRYRKEFIYIFQFYSSFGEPHVTLQEVLRYNIKTGNIQRVLSHFRGTNGYKLPIIDI